MLTSTALQSIDDLEAAYTSALEKYLTGGGEPSLQTAYEIGRAAIMADLGVLDMAELHRQAMKAALANVKLEEIDQQVKDAVIFFEESLSPFEITYRGYRDAVAIMRRVANFAFIASHEIKAPLTSILSCATMLKDVRDVDEKSLEGKLIKTLLNGVATLKSRTDDMMDIASLYSGTFSIRARPVKMRGFIHQVYEQLKPEVQWRGMKIKLRAAKNLPEVEMDPDRIQQVITNLVQNAVKYAVEGGCIDLKALIHEDHAVIVVRDRGRGLPPHEQRILLAKDKPAGRDRWAQGTGLGLILCRQIVEAHNGRIMLNSKPGRGSALEVWLPLGKKPQVRD